MRSKTGSGYSLRKTPSHWVITYTAMASPCEVLVRCQHESEAEHLASLSFSESRRIEHDFSRYRDDNEVHRINHSQGEPVEVGDELARLLDYADRCYHISGGLFDVTSGVLRKAWTFDGSPATPDRGLIESLQAQVGWEKVAWDGRTIRLRPGMEIDLGGLGKEYAVDRVAEMLSRESDAAVMVNFGGDIRGIVSERSPTPWTIGIEDPEHDDCAIGQIELAHGGVATSGDARRFCLVDGVRLGHILDPRTGWPVAGAPRSVTVIGSCCVEAGLLATLAMLQGNDAEEFLKAQEVTYHCFR